MDVELAEVRDFLAAQEPFEALPQQVLDRLPRECAVRYARRGSVVLRQGGSSGEMYVVRSGAVDITGEGGDLVERAGPGVSFGMSHLLEAGPSRYEFLAIEDTLLLVVPGPVFLRLCREHPDFGVFFTAAHHDRLRRAVDRLQRSMRGGAVLKTSVGDLLRREPVTTTRDATIREAARVMSEEAVSSLLVMDGPRLVGILTDRDLRRRVVAAGVDPGAPVETVMTPDPHTAGEREVAFEALMRMLDRNIHHLPVTSVDGQVRGLVTSTDLARLERANAVHLAGDIARQSDLAGLVTLARRIPVVLEQLVAEDATADDMGRVVTSLGDALGRRLLALAEAELGPPPVPYAWVVLGSQARREQGLGSDQDSAIVVSDELDQAGPEAAAWFGALAERVTEGLLACGYPTCPGDVMASNPQWRMSLTGWQHQFTRWARAPQPEAVLNAAIFYDMRALHGDERLVDRLRDTALSQAAGSQLLQGYLAKQALAQRPPLGFFRGFAVAKGGDHRDRVDFKAGGVGTITQLARVHALANRVPLLNTRSRLAAVAEAGGLAASSAEELADAWEFLAYLRLRHQAQQVREGLPPDNWVRPADLSGFEQRHLRDAFQVVRAAQQGLAQRLRLAWLE